MAKKYYATTPFIDAAQRRIHLHQVITSDDYDEATIKHYLHHGMIHPGNPPKPKPKAKAKKDKAPDEEAAASAQPAEAPEQPGDDNPPANDPADT